MIRYSSLSLFLAIAAASVGSASLPADPLAARHTALTIAGDSFLINGVPTFKGRSWRGYPVEGLLPNSRMVQGTFDDLNPATRGQWAYPDTGVWDPDRNTREFVAAMPSWRAYGVLAFTLNLQGGSPLGYGNKGWINTAFHEDGSLRPDYFTRLERILDRADQLGMVPIIGLFYFGQEKTLRDDASVLHAADLTLAWLHERGYRNLIIELCNETNDRGYQHTNLRPAGVPAMLRHLQAIEQGGWHYPVGVSLGGAELPSPEIVGASDVVFIHGNNRRGAETNPAKIRDMIAGVRAVPGYRLMPVVINEDDHYAFDQPDNNFIAATQAHVSWGFFDFRREGETFANGFQSVPVDWTISTARKRSFFDLAKEIFLP